MNALRKPVVARAIAIWLLITFTQSLFAPEIARALTSGPHQPEYTSYEDAGATDMVNLLTGDFNFNIPILDVPGPEGNFSLPLSYHAGIGPEQESSWVGLGWNINVGAIVRDINQYPDDANGESNTIAVKDLTGVEGWNKIYNHPFREGWNSQSGYYGNVNLLDIVEVEFGNKTSVGIVGIHVGNNGVNFDPVQFASAAISIASWGAASGATTAASIAKQAAIDLAINTAVSFAMPINTPGSPSSGHWEYQKTTKTSYHFNTMLSLLTGIPIGNRKKSYHIFLDQTRTEDMYGALYLGNAKVTPAPQQPGDNASVSINGGPWEGVKTFLKETSSYNRGSASDINFITSPSSSSPILLAPDNYIVNAAKVSGSITPYRLEIGSVAMPREMAESHVRYAPLPYLNNYKVPFIYENGVSNRYFYHSGNLVENAVLNPGFHYGLNVSLIGSLALEYFVLNDAIFGSQRIQEGVNNNTKKIPQSNHVEWFSNDEIKNSTGSTFLDFTSNANLRNDFRSNFTLQPTGVPTPYYTRTNSLSYSIPLENALSKVTDDDNIVLHLAIYNSIEDSKDGIISDYVTINDVDVTSVSSTHVQVSSNEIVPYLSSIADVEINCPRIPQVQDGIGGYTITAADGTTYHFALPIYEYGQRSEVIDKTDDDKRSILSRNAPFASTWLLTSITGPDFIDRNQNKVADDGDWGYWVKMNYGKYKDSYHWRIPYSDYNDAAPGFKTYSEGKKQLYYLNSIETRSHVALFMKSDRADGKSYGGTDKLLKLDEICLLKKESYRKLLLSPYTLSDYSNQISALCLTSLLTTQARDYINRNCLKRIVFTYGYDLCKLTPNAGNGGKLTLREITIKGRNDVSLVPSYKFEYSNNPSYSSNAWDGWGMYGFGGRETNDPMGIYGSAWSLTKVTTPIGGDISINYERDEYSSISGEKVFDGSKAYSKISYSIPFSPSGFRRIEIDHNGLFQVQDKIKISGEVAFNCTSHSDSYTSETISGEYTIVSVTENSVTVDRDLFNAPDCSTGTATEIHFDHNYGTVYKLNEDKKGGNVRVGSIALQNEFGQENKIRYLYKTADGKSSGVVSMEPEYIRKQNFDFYNHLKYPQTPVMYGRVSVLSGKLESDNDFHSREDFEFEMPHKNLLNVDAVNNGSFTEGVNSVDKYLYKIEDRTTKIGKLKSVKIFDKAGAMTSQSELSYTNQVTNDNANNYQGYFTEGTILADRQSEGTYSGLRRLNRTTLITYPYVLKTITNTKDGFTSENKVLNWDLFTGSALETLYRSSLGIYVKTVVKPAYTVYTNTQLGSKALDVNNKNMLLQVAGTYTYRSDAAGNNIGLIAASVQTWRNDWTSYRYFDGAKYTDHNEPISESNPVWRKGPAYVWKGSYRPNHDGTQILNPQDDFSYSPGASNPLWQYIGETERFDHYGMPLQTRNMSNIYSAVKMGYDNRAVIARAANAKFNEIAFSSAEDEITDIGFFGGEVTKKSIGGNAVVVRKSTGGDSHTGECALSLSTGYGFIYKSTDLESSKNYKVSVWTNSTNGRIYYKLNGSISETLSEAPLPTRKVGNWYNVELIFNTGAAFSSVEIGVKSVGGTVLFDDFRFQPAEAAMNCFVYPPLDFEFTTAQPVSTFSYVLDNDNLFTKYEHNAKGELVKVYQESFQYGEKLISESKNNYRRFNTNQ